MKARLRVAKGGRVILTLVQFSASTDGARKARLAINPRPDGSLSLALFLIDRPLERRRRAALGGIAAATAASSHSATLCFDLSYGLLMTAEEKCALARQLALCYGCRDLLELPLPRIKLVCQSPSVDAVEPHRL